LRRDGSRRAYRRKQPPRGIDVGNQVRRPIGRHFPPHM
jgi:hypothetical protein